MKRIAPGALCLALVLTACSSPPLADHLQLVPVSDKADIASGLELTYLHGTNDGALAHVSCGHAQDCWMSGILGHIRGGDSRINSLVIRTAGVSRVTWANTYQINDTYTASNGLIKTPDGGALLYGNSLVRSSFGKRPEPVYEKLDSAGTPQWGGAIPTGAIKPWSAFSDAIRTRDGGYLLVGSAHAVTNQHYWYGFLVKVGDSGKIAWAEDLNSWNDPTVITSIAQLADGDILAVGANAKRRDVALFRLHPDGKLLDSSLLKTRGQEVPIGLTPAPDGWNVAVYQKMENGEQAAIVLHLDKDGKFRDAMRYHYVDGFDPEDVVALSSRRICLFGSTSATDKPRSIAIALDATGVPVAALAMKGDSVFNAAALYRPGTVIFAGERDIGTDQRATPLLTLWSPRIKNDARVLKDVRHDAPGITVDRKAKAEVGPWTKPEWEFLKPGELPFRSIYEAGTPAAGAG